MIDRPGRDEIAPYYQKFVQELGEGSVEDLLWVQAEELRSLLRSLSPAQLDHRYAPGKWSPRQIVGHLMDTERVFVYRATCFARGEEALLPGFDENLYVENGEFDRRSLESLLEEYDSLRRATLAALEGWSPAMLARRGQANQVGFSVRSIPWIIAGHERHHLEVFLERYFPGLRT